MLAAGTVIVRWRSRPSVVSTVTCILLNLKSYSVFLSDVAEQSFKTVASFRVTAKTITPLILLISSTSDLTIPKINHLPKSKKPQD